LEARGHVCEKSSRQEKGTRQQEQAGQEGSCARETLEQGQNVTETVVEENREVSQDH
jgi:hypothetical protein